MNEKIWMVFGVTALAASLTGCGGDGSPSTSAAPSRDTTYVASREPAGAIAVGDARESAKDKNEVAVVGRIGGSAEPFVEGIAAFTIVDLKVPYCAADEGCPTPWDYCCEQNEVKKNIAMVKVVDGQGAPVAQDARQLLGVEELNTVVVHGEAQRDAQGNFAVLADKVFVKE